MAPAPFEGFGGGFILNVGGASAVMSVLSFRWYVLTHDVIGRNARLKKVSNEDSGMKSSCVRIYHTITDMSMITATTWVPRGFPAAFPKKYDIDEKEFDRIASLAQLQLDDAKAKLKVARDNDGRDGSVEEEDGEEEVSPADTNGSEAPINKE